MDDFRFDESRWPLVVVTFPHSVGVDSCRAFFEQLLAMARRGEKIGYLMDLRKFNPLTAQPALRKLAADTFVDRRPELARVTVCEARVTDGTISRGVLTAFDWMTGQKWPCENFGSMHEAERWVRAQLNAAGVELRASA